MEIVKRQQAKKSQTNVQLFTYPDGSIRIQTGRFSSYRYNDLENAFRCNAKSDGTLPIRYEVVPDIIVRAALKPVAGDVYKGWHKMQDRDDPEYTLEITSSNFHALFVMVSQGDLEFNNGWIEGEWGFRSMSGCISLKPLNSGPKLIAGIKDDEDALDISDFIPKM